MGEADFEIISLEEFAQKMRVCPNTVRNWIAAGKLVEGRHFFHEGHVYRFPWSREFLVQLMADWHPEPRQRPKLLSRKSNRVSLKFKP